MRIYICVYVYVYMKYVYVCVYVTALVVGSRCILMANYNVKDIDI